MTEHAIDPAFDLELQRVIRAPREAIWRAWTDPELLAQWWIPAPMHLRVDALEARPGGAFVTRMSEDGVAFTPHTNGVFVVAEEGRRIVFTNVIDSAWRPTSPQPVSMVAEIVLGDHADGTDYRAIARHGDPAQRDRHAELGFFEGWGAVTDQLATLVEGGSRA